MKPTVVIVKLAEHGTGSLSALLSGGSPDIVIIDDPHALIDAARGYPPELEVAYKIRKFGEDIRPIRPLLKREPTHPKKWTKGR